MQVARIRHAYLPSTATRSWRESHADNMADRPLGFFEGTEMPTAGWWEALWPDPGGVLCTVGIKSDMGVIDLCSGDGWFTLQIAKIARHVAAIDIDADQIKGGPRPAGRKRRYQLLICRWRRIHAQQALAHACQFRIYGERLPRRAR